MKSKFVNIFIGTTLAMLMCFTLITIITASEKNPDFSAFKGKWVRTDGGYEIQVGDIGAEGQIDVKYFNPKKINISEAKVSVQKNLLKLFIKLDDKGYPGSTYTLYYYAEKDALAGFYYQAMMDQTYKVVFMRRK